MDDVLAVLDHEEDLVLPAELVADLFDAFEGNFAVGLAVFSLEDVAEAAGTDDAVDVVVGDSGHAFKL